MKNDCLFCKLVAGELPSYKVYEDSDTLAFLDINPNNYGHTLVIPKDHFENIYTTPDETLCKVMIVVRKLSTAIRNGMEADGVNVTINNESAAGQVVEHLHVHIIPRHEGDWETKTRHLKYENNQALETVEKIKSAL